MNKAASMTWVRKDVPAEEVRQLALRYDLNLLEASILARRGVTQPEDLLFYLEDDLRFVPNPFLFQNMEDVVDRLNGALDDEESVLVFGDRDADGITSTVLLVEAFTELGLKVSWKVPQGDEAYGLTLAAVEEFAEAGGGLIVTVDCGISNFKEVARANDLGVDVLILDHHVAPGELPDALAIVNPKVPGETYPFATMAACAVASKVIWALRFAQTPLYNQRMCVLHCHQEEEGLHVEAVRLVNLTERRRLRLVFNDKSGTSDLQALVDFLQDQEIFVYDERAQTKLLRQLFGPGVEIGLFDLAPEIRKAFPSLAGLDFRTVKAKSRLPRYLTGAGDLDILVSLFTSSVYKAYPSLGADFTPLLDLVALGTLADLMPLAGENRILVKLGMQALHTTRREGLRVLLLKLKLLGKPLTTTDVSWQFIPTLNAAGRLGAPEKAVELLLTTDAARRRVLADELDSLNQQRKQMSQDAWELVLPLARTSLEALGGSLVLVMSPEIPRGITGLVASRLVSGFGVTSVVISRQDDRYIGSLRAKSGFETRRFLDSFSDIFTDYGGHDQAAGFNLPLEKFPAFEKRVKEILPGFSVSGVSEQTLDIDAELPLAFFTPDLIQTVDKLEPYGEGHRPLVFVARGLGIIALDLVGKLGAQHVKMTLDAGATKWPAIFFHALDRLEAGEFHLGDKVDAAFHLNRNLFQGQEKLQLTLLDLQRSKA